MYKLKENCPSVDELQDYCDDKLPEKKTTRITEHIEDCIFCTDIIECLRESISNEDEICEHILQEVYIDQNFEDIPIPDGLRNQLIKKHFLARVLDNLKASIKKSIKLKPDKDEPVLIPAFVKLIGAAITVVLIVSVGYFLIEYIIPSQPPPKKYSDLAFIEIPSYQPSIIKGKGEEELTPEGKLFDEGIEFYEEKNYSEAIKKLLNSLEKNPVNINAHFFLGICYLLEEDTEKAIEHFDFAIKIGEEIDDNLLLEKCYWYLGNAYLKKEYGERALQEFNKVVEFNGEYEKKAKKLISKIQKMK